MRLPTLSCIIICLLSIQLYAARWSWQEKPIHITQTGDFRWKPQPFMFNPGNSLRYIDYENGNDENDGTSPSGAWKHHPWDPNATGKTKDASGVHTYIFKRGVTYRGILVADESGLPDAPIQLTCSPNYGIGDAKLYGSEKITGGWQQGIHPDMPDGSEVWYIDIPFAPRGVDG